MCLLRDIALSVVPKNFWVWCFDHFVILFFIYLFDQSFVIRVKTLKQKIKNDKKKKNIDRNCLLDFQSNKFDDNVYFSLLINTKYQSNELFTITNSRLFIRKY